jgi:hypothetical protein
MLYLTDVKLRQWLGFLGLRTVVRGWGSCEPCYPLTVVGGVGGVCVQLQAVPLPSMSLAGRGGGPPSETERRRGWGGGVVVAWNHLVVTDIY